MIIISKFLPLLLLYLSLTKDKNTSDPGIQAVTAQTRSQRSTKRETFLDRMWEVIKVKNNWWASWPHSELRHSSKMVFREIDEVVCVEVDFKTS